MLYIAAFIGIADDATAAAANPAGLTNLIAPEFFLELRLDESKRHEVRAKERSFGKMIRNTLKLKNRR